MCDSGTNHTAWGEEGGDGGGAREHDEVLDGVEARVRGDGAGRVKVRVGDGERDDDAELVAVDGGEGARVSVVLDVVDDAEEVLDVEAAADEHDRVPVPCPPAM